MGEVFLALDPTLGRRVALKSVGPALAGRPDARERLITEARLAATLSHPGIAAIHHVVDSETGTYIVMEYVEGAALDDLVKGGPLPVDEVLRIGIELAEALEAAHANGIVHRDLKPANVRLAASGQVKVLDFGLAFTPWSRSDIATPLPQAEIVTRTVEVSGTPAYMAPEQLRGARGDTRSDIYSFGVLLFELLAARRPFDGASPYELAADILGRPAPDVRSLRPDVPPGLARLLSRALSKSPDDRPASAAEMGRALAAIRARGTGATPSPWRALSRAIGALRSRRAVAALALAGMLALALVLTWPHLKRWGRPPAVASREPVIAVLPLTTPAPDPALDAVASGIGIVLTSSLGAVPGLRVLSRDAVLEAGGSRRDVAKVVKELKPAFLVDPSIQRAGSRIRASVSLVRSDGSIAWSGTYDGSLDEPFDLQQQLSAGVAEALVRLGAASRGAYEAALPRLQPPTQNREAFRDYSEARLLLERPDRTDSLLRAVGLFEQATKRDPRFALAFAGLGSACWSLFQETRDEQWARRALEATVEALRLDPEPIDTRLALARLLHGTGRSAEAVKELQAAIARAPSNDEAHRELGVVYGETGQVEPALRELKAALALRPDYWRNHSFLGWLYFQIGRYEDAIKAYTRVTELLPDSARGYENLGTTYQAMDRPADALPHFNRALELNPRGWTYSNVGTMLHWQGRYEEAAAMFQKAVELGPSDPVLHRNLGDACLQAGRRADARNAYERAIELSVAQLRVNPRDAPSLSLIALCEAKLGRQDEARRRADEALALGGDSAEVLFNAAIVAALGHRADEGARLILHALDKGLPLAAVRHEEELAPVRARPEVASRLKASR
jgi:tetratricopeptide (TPR) repeat protein